MFSFAHTTPRHHRLSYRACVQHNLLPTTPTQTLLYFVFFVGHAFNTSCCIIHLSLHPVNTNVYTEQYTCSSVERKWDPADKDSPQYWTWLLDVGISWECLVISMRLVWMYLSPRTKGFPHGFVDIVFMFRYYRKQLYSIWEDKKDCLEVVKEDSSSHLL